jgi:hypothetical protein
MEDRLAISTHAVARKMIGITYWDVIQIYASMAIGIVALVILGGVLGGQFQVERLSFANGNEAQQQ